MFRVFLRASCGLGAGTGALVLACQQNKVPTSYHSAEERIRLTREQKRKYWPVSDGQTAQANAEADTGVQGAIGGAAGRFAQNFVVFGTSIYALFVGRVMNKWAATDEELVPFRTTLESARAQGKGVLTVCNHLAIQDDPIVLTSIMPPSYLLTPSKVRWGVCAEDICHKKPMLSACFATGKILPMKRGLGVASELHDHSVDHLAALLRSGEWVHLFPEGKVWQAENTYDVKAGFTLPSGRKAPPHRHLGPFKWGVGRVVADASLPLPPSQRPCVLPFYHLGMQNVFPMNEDNLCRSFVPTTGNELRVVVGEPLRFDDLLEEYTQRMGELKR